MIAIPAVVIFDFDGVILESAPIKTEAFVQLFAAYPEHVAAIREYHLANLGVSRFRKFEHIHAEIIGRPLNDETRALLAARFEELVLSRVLACPCVPGAIEACAVLRAAGCPLFVASGTPERELRRIVDARGFTAYFDGVYGSPVTKPDIIRRILAALGVDPGAALFIGDGMSDYEAAVAVAVPFIARENGEASVDWAAHGVRVLKDLRPLPTLLGVAGVGSQ